MRQMFLALPLLLAAACGQTTAPPAEPETPAVEAPAETPAPVGEPMTTGLMGGMSTTASGEVAALSLNADSLVFSADAEGEQTLSVATTFVGVLEPSAPIVAGGESFAAAAPSNTATRVEIRRITGPTPPERLCGGMNPTHVALVSADPLTVLQLMVFTGADAPGPAAHDSAVCAIYAYAVD